MCSMGEIIDAATAGRFQDFEFVVSEALNQYCMLSYIGSSL